MKTIPFILFSLLTPIFLYSEEPEPVPASLRASHTFSLVREDDEVRIYSRWIPVNEEREARQLKAEFVIDAPVGNILCQLRNDAGFTDWMKGTKSYYRIRSVTPDNWISYVQFALPWPMANQDCILHYTVSTSATDNMTFVRVCSEPGTIKSFDGVRRIRHLEVSWVLKPLGEHRTSVTYLVFSAQEPSIPRRITDPIIQKNLVETMCAFRQKCEY